MCELNDEKMDAATREQSRVAGEIFDSVFGPAVRAAEARVAKYHAAFLAANEDDAAMKQEPQS